VLQGDTLSPLLFNLVFDILMSTLVDPQLMYIGILWSDGQTHFLWTQFTDDAAVIGDSQKNTQLNITFFQRWAAWADLPIRPDKSFAYGAAQRNGKYQTILPSFLLIRLAIPPIAIGEAMTYLVRSFSYSSDTKIAKKSLTLDLTELLSLVIASPSLPSLSAMP